MQKILLLILSTSFLFITTFVSAETSLEPYCKNGYYEIPGEQICSRAPYCGGYGYDELNTNSKMPNAQECMGDGPGGREDKGCAGYVPACCYEVARTGDFTKCIGYWERLWCAPSQCDTARSRGASDSQCGDNCQCGHAYGDYCSNPGPMLPPVSLESRLGLNPIPTSTRAPTPTTPAGAPPTKQPQSANTPFPTIPINTSPAPTNTPAPPSPTKKYSFHHFVFRPPNTPTPKPQSSTPDNMFPEQETFQALGRVFVINENNTKIDTLKVEIYKKGNKLPLAQQESVSNFFMPFLFVDLDINTTYYLDTTVTTSNGRTYKQSNKCSTASSRYRCLATRDSGPLEIEVRTKDLVPREQARKAIIKALDSPKQAIDIIQQADNNFITLIQGIVTKIKNIL